MLGIGRARRLSRRGSSGAATARGAGPRPVPKTCSPASSLFPRWSRPHDVITRGGDYLRVWRLDGVPFECADEHVIAERHEAKCSLLRNLAGGQFAVWEHRLHRVIDDAMTLPPEPGFARDLARAYDSLIRRQQMMSNEHYLTLVYRPRDERHGAPVPAAQPRRDRRDPCRGASRHGREVRPGRAHPARVRPDAPRHRPARPA